MDIAVLEWCKLFAEKNGKHHWRRVVTNKDEFLYKLFQRLKMSPEEFRAVSFSVYKYRNKFVAHLDNENIMNIPYSRFIRSSTAILYDTLISDSAFREHLMDAPRSALEQYSYFYREGRKEQNCNKYQ